MGNMKTRYSDNHVSPSYLVLFIGMVFLSFWHVIIVPYTWWPLANKKHEPLCIYLYMGSFNDSKKMTTSMRAMTCELWNLLTARLVGWSSNAVTKSTSLQSFPFKTLHCFHQDKIPKPCGFRGDLLYLPHQWPWPTVECIEEPNKIWNFLLLKTAVLHFQQHLRVLL